MSWCHVYMCEGGRERDFACWCTADKLTAQSVDRTGAVCKVFAGVYRDGFFQNGRVSHSVVMYIGNVYGGCVNNCMFDDERVRGGIRGYYRW